ncbi:MAG: flagellar motor protein MotB [Planctomycetota bacterium]
MTTYRMIAIGSLVAIAFLASCHSDCTKRNEDLSNQVHQYEVELNQVKAERDESRNREDNLSRQATAARDEAKIARENANAKMTAAPVVTNDAAANAKEVKPTPADNSKALAKKLNSSLAATKAVVDTKDSKVRVVLPLGEAFASGSADLNTAGKTFCAEVAKAIIKDIPADAQITIIGHTDSDPVKKAKAKYPDNKALSLARAKEVMAEFKSAGIGSKRMTAEGLGETQPIAAGAGSKEKAKNRRVEILID